MAARHSQGQNMARHDAERLDLAMVADAIVAECRAARETLPVVVPAIASGIHLPQGRRQQWQRRRHRNSCAVCSDDQGRGEWKRRPRKNTILGKRDKKGQLVVSVKTPRRPLLRFGDGFTMGVRAELQRTAVAQGGKVGLVSTEMEHRFDIAQAINANR